MANNIFYISLFATMMGIAGTGLGGIIGCFIKNTSNKISSAFLQLSAGVMTSIVCFDLLPEGFKLADMKITLIGFILVRKYLDNAFFLWDYAIDHKYQNSGYGFTALCKFISFMQKGYNMNTMTTTYIYGNGHTKHIYEKIGFIQTDVVDKEDCHEVNMILHKRAPV